MNHFRWLVLALLAALVTGCFGYLNREGREKDFSQITQDRAAQICSVTDGQGHTAGLEIVAFYTEKAYVRYHGETGSAAQRSWHFYDENGTLLFTLTDLGNRSLIQISIEGEKTTYRFRSLEKENE